MTDGYDTSEGLSPGDVAKRAAARRACALVEDGMCLGLGTGSTAAWLVRALGERVAREGLRITGVPTSRATADLAREVGIEVVSLEDHPAPDLVIDGADEVDGRLDLVKGGGGALLREKIVATASARMVVIADASKRVGTLGAFPLPVEIVPFGWKATRSLILEALEGLDVAGRETSLRMGGDAPFLTDEGNHILDLRLGRIGQARRLSLALNQIPGVVENGLFTGICDMLVLGHGDGRVECQDVASEGRAGSGDIANVFA